MSSFTRTIPAWKGKEFVRALLREADGFFPLAYKPAKANPGDFIYLIFSGQIVGRARIARIDPADPPLSEAPWAKWLIRSTGAWQRPPRNIPAQGHQSVRYLETQGLAHLDGERW